MKRGLSAVLVLACCVALPALAAKGDAAASGVQGEVLDLACWVAKGVSGADHAGCARKCLQEGQPMGLLAADGTVYLLMADHADSSAYVKAKQYAGQKVEVRGPVSSKSGLKAITVESVKPL